MNTWITTSTITGHLPLGDGLTLDAVMLDGIWRLCWLFDGQPLDADPWQIGSLARN